MTKAKTPAALLAAVLVVSLWLPTLAMPQAQANTAEAPAATLLVPALA